MTALADALTAAQRQAISALEKAYLAGAIDAEALAATLTEIGCPDAVDGGQLLAALDVLREHGAPAPAAAGYAERRKSEPATEPQRALIARLCDERQIEPPDLAGVTKPQASEIITSLQDGSYDPSKWSVPF